MDNELKHYGVPGMKWGVRRARPSSSGIKRTRPKPKNEAENIKESRKKDLRKRRILSDADLEKRIRRIKLEKEFKSLTEEDISPGRKVAKEILASSSKKVLSAAASGAMAYGIKKIMTKEHDWKEVADYVVPNPNKKK